MEDKCPEWIMRLKNNKALGKVLIVLMLILLALALTRCSLLVNTPKSEHAVVTAAEECEFYGWVINETPNPCFIQISKVCGETGERLIIYEGVVTQDQPPVKIGLKPGKFYTYFIDMVTMKERWDEYEFTHAELEENYDNGLVPYFIIQKAPTMI